jgi:hypothetical protein
VNVVRSVPTEERLNSDHMAPMQKRPRRLIEIVRWTIFFVELYGLSSSSSSSDSVASDLKVTVISDVTISDRVSWIAIRQPDRRGSMIAIRPL